jgi:hypothetical protein
LKQKQAPALYHQALAAIDSIANSPHTSAHQPPLHQRRHVFGGGDAFGLQALHHAQRFTMKR